MAFVLLYNLLAILPAIKPNYFKPTYLLKPVASMSQSEVLLHLIVVALARI